jgi:hypothetical protein
MHKRIKNKKNDYRLSTITSKKIGSFLKLKKLKSKRKSNTTKLTRKIIFKIILNFTFSIFGAKKLLTL